MTLIRYPVRMLVISGIGQDAAAFSGVVMPERFNARNSARQIPFSI
jgi:hypothetical protein